MGICGVQLRGLRRYQNSWSRDTKLMGYCTKDVSNGVTSFLYSSNSSKSCVGSVMSWNLLRYMYYTLSQPLNVWFHQLPLNSTLLTHTIFVKHALLKVSRAILKHRRKSVNKNVHVSLILRVYNFFVAVGGNPCCTSVDQLPGLLVGQHLGSILLTEISLARIGFWTGINKYIHTSTGM